MTLSDEALDDMLRFIEYCNEVRRQEQSRISEMTELTAEVNLLGEGVAKEPQTA
jgi:hypothetical protein